VEGKSRSLNGDILPRKTPPDVPHFPGQFLKIRCMEHGEKKIPILLKADPVSAILGISRSHLYHLVQRGEIPAVLVGDKSVRFLPDDVKTFIHTRRLRGKK
jgi:excisionase family DNA binding protein